MPPKRNDQDPAAQPDSTSESHVDEGNNDLLNTEALKASAATIIRDALANGPVQGGQAVLNDRVDWASIKLMGADKYSVIHACAEIAEKNNAVIDDRGFPMAIAVANLLVTYPDVMERGHKFHEDVELEISAAAHIAADALEDCGFTSDDVAYAVAMVEAMKISFWQTNHHVGSGNISTIVRKMAAVVAPRYGFKNGFAKDADVWAFLRPTYYMSHMVSTRSVLAALGVVGIKDVKMEVAMKVFAAGKDFRIRVSAPPAGTAKVMDVCAAIDIIVMHPARYAIEFTADMVRLLRARQDIRKNPVAYHVGSQFLVGKQTVVVDDPAEDTVRQIYSVLDVIARNSSLRNAMVFNNASSDRTVRDRVMAVVQKAREKVQDSIDKGGVFDAADMSLNVSDFMEKYAEITGVAMRLK